MENPKKPHFFTFVSPHPHSQNGSLIPISFMHKYLNGVMSENALLKKGCKNWHVKIEGRRFVNGWEKFEKENGLELGDFIVFRHEGDFVFEVMVFGPSLCEKEYPPPSTTTGDETKKTITPKPETKSPKETLANFQATSKDVKKDKASMPPSNANAKSSRNNPSFSATLTQYSIKKSVLCVPNKFAKLNGLSNKECDMVIRDESLRPWPVKLRDKKAGPSSRASVIGGGWSKFCTENDLKTGDEFVLELVETGEKPVLNLHLMSKDAKKDKEVKVNPSAKASSSKHGNRRSFSATLTQSGIDNSFLHVPNKFVRLNGLSNMQCEIIIRDERLRPWSVKLRNKKTSDSHQACVFGRGWREFCVGNGLKEGDEIVLELVKKGEKPVMNFCLRRKTIKTGTRIETTTTSAGGSYPYFIATVNEYNIKRSALYLPSVFARQNGVSNGEMILRMDGNRGSWLVDVRDTGKYVYIGHGWRDFRVANNLKIGDCFKFELVDQNGNKPIVNFSLKSKDVKKDKEVKVNPTTNANSPMRDTHRSFSTTLTRSGIATSFLTIWVKRGNPRHYQSKFQPSSSSLIQVAMRGVKREVGERSSIGFLRCYCGDVAPLKTSWTDLIPGRRFVGCANYEQHIPSKFVRLNGLTNIHCEMIIRDERLRPWSVQLKNRKRSYSTRQESFIAGGWRNFCIGNGLKQGDEVVLELVKKGEKPVMNFSLRRKLVKTCTKAETTNTSAGGSYPYFITTLNEFNIKKSTLYLPNGFARKNSLHSGEMILRNGNQGSWLVDLRDIGKCAYIGRGWRDFQVANNLTKGDCFKFELIENGKKPIANFSLMETLGKNAPKVENSSGET